jgi:hypothetical protein
VTTTGALAVCSAHQPGDAGSRWAIAVADMAEVVESRRWCEIGSAWSEKLRRLVVLPSNKPLQRTIPPRDIVVTSTNRSCGGLAAERQTVRRSDDAGARFLGGSSSTCKMVTTIGALATGSARQPGDAGLRWAIVVADVAKVVESRRWCEIGSA